MTSTTRPTRRSRTRYLLIGATAIAMLMTGCSGGGSDSDRTDASSATDDGGTAGDTSSATEGSNGDGAGSGTDGSGTGGDSTVPADAEGMEPVAGGTLRYSLEADVDGLNPTSSSLSAPGLQMAVAVFDTLAMIDADGNWQPFLAESITPNDDFSVWTVKLRPNITFHDGEPVNADALLFNYESQRADPTVGLAVGPFFPETGGVVKVDDLTVEFHPLDKNSQLPVTLAGQLGMVASPKWLEAAAADATLNQKPIGSGPFKFDSRTEDSITKMVRNDDWWGGEVYLDAVEFLPEPENSARVELLRSGEVQALHTTDNDAILTLQESDGIENLVETAWEESFAMINTQAPPFDDIRARQALTYAAPVQDYVDLIGLGVSPRADQMFTPDSKWYNPDVVQHTDDPDAAAPLVEAYCAERGTEENPVLKQPTCTDGKINMEFQWAGPSDVQSQIADMMKEGWGDYFNVTFDELAQDDHIVQTATGQYNVNTWRQFGGADPTVDNVWLMCRTIGGISLNWPRFCDEERDQALLDAMATTDETVRAEKYRSVVQSMHDAYSYIFYIHTAWDNAWSDNVHGVCDHPIPDTDLKAACAQNGRIWLSNVWIEP